MPFKRLVLSIFCLALSLFFVLPASAAVSAGAKPKYVFMFIADGLSYGQMGVTQAYLGALQGKVENVDLSMTKFPVIGSAATYDSTSFAPDSASTATSYATGFKTLSGVINMDETKSKSYETISEKLKKQHGWKVGVISTVNLNHATPAAYYGHQPSRGNYYELTQELIGSGFEYFAGGKFLDSRKGDFDPQDIYKDMQAKGYTVITTSADFKALKDPQKVVIVSDDKANKDDTGAMHYAIDIPQGQPTLADYVKTGIKTLDNDKGFFMMVEGGKVDWAAHANDAATVISDVLSFNKALDEAVAFYNEHPGETLIIVTGDHETGGLSIGFAGTGYDTHLEVLAGQKRSFTEYDKKIAAFRAEKAGFDAVMASIEEDFGLVANTNAAAAGKPLLSLSDYEYGVIKGAYEKSMIDPKERSLNEAESLLYGTYEPLSVTLTHILNQKAGIGWTSYAHTGLPVPVFALGAGQDLFEGFYDNTQVYHKLKTLTNVQ